MRLADYDGCGCLVRFARAEEISEGVVYTDLYSRFAADVLLLMVAHTVEDVEAEADDLIVRIISARTATAQERGRYEGNTH